MPEFSLHHQTEASPKAKCSLVEEGLISLDQPTLSGNSDSAETEDNVPLKDDFGVETSSELSAIVKSSSSNVDPNEKNKYGETSLHVASQNGHFECVKILLDFKGDPTLKDNQGNTPLDVARNRSQDPCLILRKEDFLNCIRLIEQSLQK